MIKVVAIVKCSVCFSWLGGTDGVFDVYGQGVGMPTYDVLDTASKGELHREENNKVLQLCIQEVTR
jgi:hypothetical protein